MAIDFVDKTYIVRSATAVNSLTVMKKSDISQITMPPYTYTVASILKKPSLRPMRDLKENLIKDCLLSELVLRPHYRSFISSGCNLPSLPVIRSLLCWLVDFH